MPHFILVTQHPKPKSLGEGSLSIEKSGDADFFEGNAEANARVLARMVRVRIEWAAAAGILISGMEPDGIDRAGQAKFKHQEWLLRHLQPNTVVSGIKSPTPSLIQDAGAELVYSEKLSPAQNAACHSLETVLGLPPVGIDYLESGALTPDEFWRQNVMVVHDIYATVQNINFPD